MNFRKVIAFLLGDDDLFKVRKIIPFLLCNDDLYKV